MMWRSNIVMKSLLRDVTKRTPTFRQFASSGYRDPGYMVAPEAEIDSDRVKVPLMTDATRKEMYKKHKDDPEKHTIPSLSNQYNCSVERVKAVIFLLRKREKMMFDLGVADIKSDWKIMTLKHQEDPEINTPQALSEEFEMTVDEINDILKKMKEHLHR